VISGKPTSGPWFVAPDGFSVTDKRVWLDEEGARHGETPNIVIFAETKANARLIAAAPEMLEALKAFLAYDEQDGESDVEMMLAYGKARDMARAAIAKAEGQS